MSQLRSCVIYNPQAGRGRAARFRNDILARLPAGTELLATESVGHGIALARDAAEHFDRVIAAGGDGTVHEVANGLLQANRPDVLFAVIPIGSANDYAFSLGVDQWWREGGPWSELVPVRLDVGRIQSGAIVRYFVNGCGIGFNGLVALEARSIRWLRGIPLYSLAVIRTLISNFRSPNMLIHLDDHEQRRATLVQSFAIGHREGGFPLALDAKLDDGLFNCLHVGRIRRWELLRHLPSMITGNLPKDHPNLSFATCRRARVSAEVPLCVHIDGEIFSRPGADGFRELQIELLPAQLLVETWKFQPSCLN